MKSNGDWGPGTGSANINHDDVHNYRMFIKHKSLHILYIYICIRYLHLVISPEGSGLFSFCHAGGNNDASKFITIHMYLMCVFIIRAIMCKVITYTYIIYVYLQIHIYTYVEAYCTSLPICAYRGVFKYIYI